MKRILGRSGIEVSAVGMGCWAIGGPWTFEGSPAGWSEVDDTESIRAIHAALDMGVNFFDTAANYGCGHSERILGQALEGRRENVVIATKFGHDVNEDTKEVVSYPESQETAPVAQHLREDLEKSLKRLGTDYIDVYQLHVWDYGIEASQELAVILEELVKEGKLRCYGWSTDRPDAVRAFASGEHCSVVQQQLNIFDSDGEMLELCDEIDLASINRGPLGMGVLTGKFTAQSSFPDDDVRKHSEWFEGLIDGHPNPEWLNKIESIREIIISEGRSLAQGALAWIWGRSNRTVPIPGFKTVAQVQENAGAMDFGPLTSDQMSEIETVLDRT
ncbi:MAG: aldo/keto reductase [Chloroflexi bacterium]|nr:MAG: aldo/keto reductase [Chloroflexota bacterium]MBL1197250.1 aldo/keto reductase [Chloroflexota bacterium]NOH14543.1 aldo/keto reductase [Chloroflexota bacterium]